MAYHFNSFGNAIFRPADIQQKFPFKDRNMSFRLCRKEEKNGDCFAALAMTRTEVVGWYTRETDCFAALAMTVAEVV